MKYLILILSILVIACALTKPPLLRSINFAADAFNPVHDVDYYTIYAFRVSDFVIVTKPQIYVNIPDTLEVSWNQPKRRTALSEQPKPMFYQHVDTAKVVIDNNPSLYRWLTSGNDSSVWLDAKLEGLYEGSWELSVRTFANDGTVSQFSEPFEFVIRFVKVPAAPIDLRLWIKP
jgi:hypothetical protein